MYRVRPDSTLSGSTGHRNKMYFVLQNSPLVGIMSKCEEKQNIKGCLTEENMKHAMNDVLMGNISIREAVMLCAVPKSSLHSRINEIKKWKITNVPPKLGRFELKFSDTYE